MQEITPLQNITTLMYMAGINRSSTISWVTIGTTTGTTGQTVTG